MTLEAKRLVRAVRDHVDAELAFRRLDRGVGFAGRHAIAFGEQFEMMDQRFHVVFISTREGGTTL